MSIQYIKVPRYFWIHKIFQKLTQKQIIALLYRCENSKENIEFKKSYGKKLNRYKYDCNIILQYLSIIEKTCDDLRKNNNNFIKLVKGNAIYYKMKPETLHLLIKNKFSKIELLIVLWIETLYYNTFKREWKFEFKDIINEIIGENTNSDYYKNKIIDTLNKCKEWKYENKDVFIKNFIVEKNTLHLNLDPKQKR